MVEASGYLFQDVEALLKRAQELMAGASEETKEEEAKIRTQEQIPDAEPVVDNSYRESLNGSMQKLDEISSRYRDDAEASLIRNKLAEFLEELDSGELTAEMQAQRLGRIIEEVHHLVEWRRLSTASGRDLSLKSRRRTREDVQKR